MEKEMGGGITSASGESQVSGDPVRQVTRQLTLGSEKPGGEDAGLVDAGLAR
jgi:hypothetical protein